MGQHSIIKVPVAKVTDDGGIITSDALAIEEPLEIRVEYGPFGERKVQNISVTMRTPGNDAELAAGFLFTEGIVKTVEDISAVDYQFIACAENKENVIVVRLNDSVVPHLQNADRNFYTTSSCGVCGKGSINAIRTVSAAHPNNDKAQIDGELLYALPDILKQQQAVFADTGGLHASALFDVSGKLLLVREDVGRHNALDKLIGAALRDKLALTDKILLLSGRASFELVQKAIMAGINIVAAVGAPSSLAVELAAEFNITLVGFLRDHRFNIYTAAHRVLIHSYEDSH